MMMSKCGSNILSANKLNILEQGLATIKDENTQKKSPKFLFFNVSH